MKFKTLDLHGHYHDEVEILVSNFIFLNDPPVQIITGKSNRMRELVQQILERYGFECHIKRWINDGCLIVDRKREI